MRVISFDNARATWLFPLEEFAPASGATPQSILAEISERYNFTRRPDITTREDMNQKGLLFGIGRFSTKDQSGIINDFAIYTDGIAAVSERTDFAEAFLTDVFEWVVGKFNFRRIDTKRRLYSSTIVVEFDRSPARLISGYEQLLELINSRIDTIMKRPASVQFTRLGFEMDPKELAGGQVAVPKFLLERRGLIEYAKERYFSSATMQTAAHLEVLNEIEKMAATLSTGAQRPS
jgi:hypothetical protein